MTDEKLNNPSQNEDAKPGITMADRRSMRSQRHALKKEERDNSDLKQRKWVQIRLLPIWLRILLVLLLLVGAAILGAMIGYGYLGDGTASDVLKKETWTHILDIIKGVES